MATYLIVDAEDLVADPAEAEVDGRANEYRVIAQQSIHQYGGRYLVQGAQPDAVSGDWPDGRVVTVIEFPDRATLDRWHISPEYTRAAELRRASIDARMLIAEGIAG